MITAVSDAVDPLILQLNDDLDKIEPKILEFNEKIDELSKLVPQNLSTVVFKFKGELDRIEKDRAKKRLFKRIPNEKSPIIDFEKRIQDLIDKKVQNQFDSSKKAKSKSLAKVKKQTDQLNDVKQKISEIIENDKKEIEELTTEIEKLVPLYTSGTSVPRCLLDKLERDYQNFTRQISDFDSEVDSYTERTRMGRMFESKFKNLSKAKFEFDDDDSDDESNGKETYKVPDLTVPFYNLKSDVDDMISKLTGEAMEVENKFVLLENSIGRIKSTFVETGANQEDMAVVLHNTEDQALDLLCTVDQTQETVDSISITDDINQIKEEMNKSMKDIKQQHRELKQMIQKMEDDNDDEQLSPFVN